MALGLTDTLAKPEQPEDEDLFSTQPVKKPGAGQPLPLGQNPGAPGAAPALAGPGAAITSAQTNSPDPMAFMPPPGGGASLNVVAPPDTRLMDDGGLPIQPAGPTTPVVEPRMTPTDRPTVPVTTPTAPAQATQDVWSVLYGPEGEKKRAEYIAAGGDPNDDAAVWASYSPGPNTMSLEERSKIGEAAKERFNQYSRGKGFAEAGREAEGAGDDFAGGAGFFSGEEGLTAPPGAQTRDDYEKGFIQQVGYDPVTKAFTDPKNTVNGQVMAPDPITSTDPQFNTGAFAPNSSVSPSAPGSSMPSGGIGPFGGTSGVAGVDSQDIDPNDPLIGQQFSPNQGVDRVKVFQDALNSTIENVLNPQREAAARDLNRYSFGLGRGVSGKARTSQGDLADRYDQRVADLSAQGLASATTGSIDDMYRNLDELQQERGFQKDLSDTAFGQSVTATQLEEMLTSGAFGRALQQGQFGEMNNPSDIALILSQIFGGQSSEAMQAAARLFGGLGSRSGQTSGGGGGGGDGLDIGALIEWLVNRGGGGQRTTGAENIDYGGGLPA